MSFPEDFLRRVRESADIIALAGEMTQLKKAGKRWTGLCPFHREKSPSFGVNPDLGLYHCFGCGAGGDVIDLYMRHSGDDFRAAVEALALRSGIPLPEEGQKVDTSAGEALEAAQAFFVRSLAASEAATTYLDARGIAPELRSRYGLGYAPEGWSNLSAGLKGISPQALLDVGLIAENERGKRYDRFRNRLMFPICTASGRVVGFGGRTLGEDRAKYINTAETEFFKKSELLFGLAQAKRGFRDTGKAVLAEGYFDVLAFAAAEIPAVAAMGTALSAAQAKDLAKYAAVVTMAYDGDKAGKDAASRSLPVLLAAGLDVKTAIFGDGEDPDSVRQAGGPAALRVTIEAGADALLAEASASLLGAASAVQRSVAVRHVLGLVGQVKDPIARELYGREVSARLGIGQAVKQAVEKSAAAPLIAGTQDTETQRRLVALLLEAQELPSPRNMPPSEVFSDLACREIYAAYMALYSTGAMPAPLEVRDETISRGRIDPDAFTAVAMAQTESTDFQSLMAMLVMIWIKRRRVELQHELQSATDPDHVSALVTEIQKLRHYPNPFRLISPESKPAY